MHLAGFKILSQAYEKMTFSGVSLCAAFIKAMHDIAWPSNFETNLGEKQLWVQAC